jgi:DNA modification methylase
MINQILQGDCLEVLKSLPDNSVDSIVTDPPYGISFMGKKWDYDVPSVAVWEECLRVLKPGGHALIACGTRTQHRMAVNIEDAGFEIRDVVIWAYGSGFPKSLNIGKAVDKLQGNERVESGIYEFPDGLKRNSLNDKGTNQCDRNSGEPIPKNYTLTKGTSAWEGWGTALKPAVELWTLARKPLSEKTVAENVLKWGTGGINIDECRVEFISEEEHEKTKRIERGNYDYGSGHIQQLKARPVGAETISNPEGRFPANLIHDGSDEVVSLFPNTKSGALKSDCYKEDRENDSIFAGGGNFEHKGYKADSGSASRFFYCAKASKSERNKGCEALEEKERIDYGGFHSEKGLIENNRNPENRLPMKNNHPTVKPVALLQYLIRLITPPQGTVLDCFAGSGSTGVACIKENKNYILIEREPEYVQIINARVSHEHKQPKKYPTLFEE